MKHRMSRTTLIAMAGALALVATAVPASAGNTEASTSATANTILMVGGKRTLRFVGPESIVAGEELKVVNQTKASKVGPHTLSLALESTLPKTRKARKLCFTPKHICKEIADWHGVKGNGPPTKNPVDAGKEGWDTMGSLTKDGDSWFTGAKPNASFTQRVTVDTSDGAETIHFICAIHSWMQGSIDVLPPTGS